MPQTNDQIVAELRELHGDYRLHVTQQAADALAQTTRALVVARSELQTILPHSSEVSTERYTAICDALYLADAALAGEEPLP